MRTEQKPPNTESVVLPSMDPRPRMLRAGMLLSWMVVVVVAAASLGGVLVSELYASETPWGREAFRGGDVVTLAIAMPVLIAALVLVRRGSVRAVPVWIAMLFYTFYLYTYATFGATFNDAFGLHIAAFSLSLFALACALPALDYPAISAALRTNRWAKPVGIFLVVVGIGQGALWTFLVVRNAFTGEVLPDIPVLGQHVVFAIDLALLVPMLIVSGVLLARRTPSGFLLGTAMAVMGAIAQVNLNVAALYQANADVAGVKAFPPEGVFLTITFALAALALLLGGRDTRRGHVPARNRRRRPRGLEEAAGR